MRTWRRLVSPQGILRIAIFAALFPVAGLFGGFHWTLDLCNHFQAQYFCFLLATTVLLALWRKAAYAFAVFILLLLPASRLAPLYLPASSHGTGPTIRVACFNILGTNQRYAEAVAWIRKAEPDIIYLPETNEAWGAGLAPLDAIYPHGLDLFIEGNFGFSFRSKHPLVRHEIHRPPKLGVPLLQAVIHTPHGEVTVFGAHPVPPVTAFWANERDTYLNSMNELALNTQGHLIILGDLNATCWSRSLTPFFKQGIRDTSEGHGYSATWMRENPLMTIPIDHIMTRGFSGTTRRVTGPALGSDHRPVVADLSW